MTTNDDTTTYRQYDLLAKHLGQRFGNINDSDDHEIQQWTPDLRDAVRRYLLEELPNDVGRELFVADQLGDKVAKSAAIEKAMTLSQPWELAHAVREAAVRAVPTLDQLIGHLTTWPSEDERTDADIWLDAHATDEQLKSIARQLRTSWFEPFDLVHDHEPPALLRAWERCVGSAAPNDLADAEWELVEPFLPPRRRQSARQALNGMLYRSAHDVPWSHIPPRYGDPTNLYYRHQRYRAKGVFRRMLDDLQDQAEAARIVEWLRQVDDGSI